MKKLRIAALVGAVAVTVASVMIKEKESKSKEEYGKVKEIPLKPAE